MISGKGLREVPQDVAEKWKPREQDEPSAFLRAMGANVRYRIMRERAKLAGYFLGGVTVGKWLPVYVWIAALVVVAVGILVFYGRALRARMDEMRLTNEADRAVRIRPDAEVDHDDEMLGGVVAPEEKPILKQGAA